MQGLSVEQIESLTGRPWYRWGLGRPKVKDEYRGPGGYIWVSRSVGLVYAGQAADVRRRLTYEWPLREGGDILGREAFGRMVSRHQAVPWYSPTDTVDEARDVEALVAALHVHLCGRPPMGCGTAWAPRSGRAMWACEVALRAVEAGQTDP